MSGGSYASLAVTLKQMSNLRNKLAMIVNSLRVISERDFSYSRKIAILNRNVDFSEKKAFHGCVGSTVCL